MTLQLRALDLDDAAEIHRICAHPEVMGGLVLPLPDGQRGWKEQMLASPHERTMYVGAFDATALRGFASLAGMPRARQRHVASVGLAVDPAISFFDVGSRLLAALCDAADRWWGFVRLEIDVLADDVRAIALLGRHGFEVEVRKRCGALRDGRWLDVLHVARIRPGFVAPAEIGAAPPTPARRPRLERGAIAIRASRFDDARGLAELHQTESVIDGTFVTPFASEREWRARLASSEAGSGVRGIVAIVDGTIVGSCALFPHSTPPLVHAAGLGIAVHPDAQGRGVGDALMTSILELADRRLGVRRVQLEVYADNTRAQALYRKHGFETEGRQRLAAFRRGTYVDVLVMSRLRAGS